MPVQYIPHPIRAIVSYPVRVTDVNYQNTTLRPMLVICSVACHTLAVVGNSEAWAIGRTDPFSPPTSNVSGTGLHLIARTVIEYDFGTIVLLVPPGYFWRIHAVLTGVGSGVGITYCQEVNL